MFIDNGLATQLAVFDLVPDLFIRIEMRGVSGKKEQAEALAMGTDEITYLVRTMEAGVIGEHDHQIGVLVQETAQEVNVLVALHWCVQDTGEQLALGRDRGEDVVSTASVARRHDRRGVHFPPGTPRTGHDTNTGFVEEDNDGPFFLASR